MTFECPSFATNAKDGTHAMQLPEIGEPVAQAIYPSHLGFAIVPSKCGEIL